MIAIVHRLLGVDLVPLERERGSDSYCAQITWCGSHIY